MSEMLDSLRAYYRASGLTPEEFSCARRSSCAARGGGISGPRQAFVGEGYEHRAVPRLLFVSLDPGSTDETDCRTTDEFRHWQRTNYNVDHRSFHKGRHWYLTHRMALQFLAPFLPGAGIRDIHQYFAHTNSAKCCMNKSGRRMADNTLFDNCRGHLAGEIVALQPDVVVTQGRWAATGVGHAFQVSLPAPLATAPEIVDLAGRSVLWFHAYHPRCFGPFRNQMKTQFPAWAATIRAHFASEFQSRVAADSFTAATAGRLP